MLIDGRDPANSLDFDAEICIVGAGAAGITLARDLIAGGKSVLLLESGGADFDPDVQNLADGSNVGVDYYPLRDARLRFFGGTTAIWGGRCVELDPIDFRRRSHVPHSGWPVTYDEMVPWFEKAHTTLGLKRIADHGAHWRALGLGELPFDPEKLDMRFWQFDESADRFTLGRCGDLTGSDRATIILNVTARKIVLADGDKAVDHIELATLTGRTGAVRAKHYVLALGGMETPRLMLASRQGSARGFGGDAVGRYFMEHPHGRGGEVRSDSLWRVLTLLPRSKRINGKRQAAILRLSETEQMRRQTLNTSLTLAVRRPAESGAGTGRAAYSTLRHALPSTKIWRSAWRISKAAATRYRETVDPLWPWLAVKAGGKGLYASIRGEQAPNPDSRIKLSRRTDALGIPQAELDWKLSPIDRHSVSILIETLDAALRANGIGRVVPADWLSDQSQNWAFDEAIGNHAIGGYHHMGTTRMADNPSIGVVDENCTVFGVSNLHIAGSSVFTTGGWANPTLPLLAFVHRLAARIIAMP